MPACLYICMWVCRCTWAAVIWRALHVCDVGRGQPLVGVGAVQRETPGCITGGPWRKAGFLLSRGDEGSCWRAPQNSTSLSVWAGRRGGGLRGGGTSSHLSNGNGSSAFICAVCLDFRLCRQALSLTVCTVLGPVSPDLCQGTQAPLQY